MDCQLPLKATWPVTKMSINQRTEIPLYAQFKNSIIDEIAQGRLKAGDRLPSHRELCEQYQISHMTVRRAINELSYDGVIVTVPGKGMYVAASKQDADAGPLVSFHDDIALRGMKAGMRTLDSRIESASTALAQIMGIEVGAPLVYLMRLMLASGVPMAVARTYLPLNLCPGLLDSELEDGSLYATLRSRYGLHLGSAKRTAEAVLADEDQAELLGLRMPAALLLIEQITLLDTGKAVEYSRIFYRGDQYRFKAQ
jgi:GntR family transcriptional regulator